MRKFFPESWGLNIFQTVHCLLKVGIDKVLKKFLIRLNAKYDNFVAKKNNNSHIKIQRFKLSSPAEKYSGFPWNVKKYLKYFIKKIENCQDVHVLQNDCAKIQIPENSILQTASVCKNTNSSFRKNSIYLLSSGKIRYCRVVTRFVPIVMTLILLTFLHLYLDLISISTFVYKISKSDGR